MSKYLKIYTTHDDYINDIQNFDHPNVSHCINDEHVHYELNANGHSYVDLKLPSGTLWATMNVGASSETDNGLFFAWGETQGYTAAQVGSEEGKKAFTWDDYKYGTDSNLTKYNTSDGLTTLELSDDAASINWGSDWKTPTKAQFDELMINTEWYLVNSDGTIVSSGTGGSVDEKLINYGITVNGVWFVINKADIGDLTKGLFFPACGNAGYNSVSSIGQSGAYLSSSLVETNQKFFQDLEFSANFATAVTLAFRNTGYSVRGVLNTKFLNLRSTIERLLVNQNHQGNLTAREMQLINTYIGSNVLGEPGLCWYDDNDLTIVTSNSEFNYHILLDSQYNVITYYISENSVA